MSRVLVYIHEIRIDLINVLKNLRDLGNTVIIVEHEEEIMRAADEVIDIGPKGWNFWWRNCVSR
jgi:excinuclease UvrABC ATPase subunit